MKANTSALMRKGYTTGVLSGMTWGLDTVLIGVAMAMAPFVENPVTSDWWNFYLQYAP